jgi:hypothetical protein
MGNRRRQGIGGGIKGAGVEAEKGSMGRLSLLLAFLLALPSSAASKSQITCACEWSPWTHVHYLSCLEIQPDGRTARVISQQPFTDETECNANATRAETTPPPAPPVPSKRAPAALEGADGVNCECEWSPWKSNYLLSCTAWHGSGQSMKILDRMAFGSKGKKSQAERSCLAAKSVIERKTSVLRAP